MIRSEKNKFHVIIPARIDSTRLPNKMLLDVTGMPLIIKTATQAKKSHALRVIVATDSPQIQDVCATNNIESIMTSKEHLSGTDRIAEAVKILNLSAYEIIINLQGDEPLINPNLINDLAKFINHNNAEVATVAHKILKQEDFINPNIVKMVLDKYSNALYFSRASIPFYRDNMSNNINNKNPEANTNIQSQLDILGHIGIYAYRAGFLNNYLNMPIAPIENVEKLEQLRIIYNGYKVAVLVTDKIHEKGVDTIEDLNRVRELLLK